MPLLECLAERRFAFVSDEGGDLGGRQPVFPNHLDGLVHSPARQISQRRFPDKCGEPVGERRARHPGQACQLLDRPGTLRRPVDIGDGLADPRVRGGGEPVRLLIGNSPRVRSNRLNEEDVGEPGDDGFGARSSHGGFGGDEVERGFKPVNHSATLVRELTRLQLVDEYRFLVYPIVLGSGKRVFADQSQVGLKLSESKSFGSGVVLLRYHLDK